MDRQVTELWFKYIRLTKDQKAEFYHKIGFEFAATKEEFITKPHLYQESVVASGSAIQ